MSYRGLIRSHESKKTSNIFKVVKEKKNQLNILYSAIIYLISEGQMKTEGVLFQQSYLIRNDT